MLGRNEPSDEASVEEDTDKFDTMMVLMKKLKERLGLKTGC